jgi:putative flavoprotein involved in K+ transport
MLDRTDTTAATTEAWLAQFNEALAAGSEARLRPLFQPDSYWRDVLA